MVAAEAVAGATPAPNPDDTARLIVDHAVAALGSTGSPQEARKRLVQIGLDEAAAAKLIGDLINVRRDAMVEAKRKGAGRNIGLGLLWFVGGSLVTLLTYGAASSGGGGKYVIAWGAILFGGIQALIGLFQRNPSFSDAEVARSFKA
jgi:hypothetical protein